MNNGVDSYWQPRILLAIHSLYLIYITTVIDIIFNEYLSFFQVKIIGNVIGYIIEICCVICEWIILVMINYMSSYEEHNFNDIFMFCIYIEICVLWCFEIVRLFLLFKRKYVI